MSPRKVVPVEESPEEAPQWTQEQLLAHKHLGPAILGHAMWEAAQLVSEQTDNGRFGPALL